METVISSTKSHLTCLALTASLGLALSACAPQSSDTKSPEASKADQTVTTATSDGVLCEGFGPQTPRDISSQAGLNLDDFQIAPPASDMNLCNIHTHTNAEHKGPDFSVYAGPGASGGYKCNATDSLTDAEKAPYDAKAYYKGVVPGDTIEVHWVHSTCDITPGEGLGSCLSDTCENPRLRVEAQTFLVVNDSNAADFTDYDYAGSAQGGLHQAKAIPGGTGVPVQFRGSTTGPKYTQSVCSPVKVSWSVRPNCTKLDIGSLHKWAKQGNVFNEAKSHGVRDLVTAPELLSPIP